MGSYTKVLVAIDLTSEAQEVLTAAKHIAERENATLSVIHVADNPVSPYTQWSDYPVPFNESQIRQALFTRLSEIVAAAGLDHSQITIDFGRPIDVIVMKAQQDGVDLIVVGSHGRHGVKLLLGSTANGVLHAAKCDVLSVRVSD